MKPLTLGEVFLYFMAGSAFFHIYIAPLIDWITRQ